MLNPLSSPDQSCHRVYRSTFLVPSRAGDYFNRNGYTLAQCAFDLPFSLAQNQSLTAICPIRAERR
jgi:hypothetical protein